MFAHQVHLLEHKLRVNWSYVNTQYKISLLDFFQRPTDVLQISAHMCVI